MIRGDRLKLLLERHGISQAQLAERVGVSQPTIFKMIHNNKSGSKHLHAVARVLGTSPEFLTGVTDDDSISAIELAYSPQDREWIDLLHDLDRKSREAVIQLARSLSDGRRVRHADDEPSIPVLQDKVLAYRGQE